MTDHSRFSETELGMLADDFDIVGELSVGQGTRFLIATKKAEAGARRDDAGRVLIEIVRPPEGDEAHALDQLASDTKLLSRLRHRRLVSIVDGRWLGDSAFAVVREYFDDPSVADLIARGEPFTNTRAAAILREVHGVLQWARNQNVVHRRLATDRVFLEPTSDRVRVSFAAGPLPRVRITDAATEDVVTVVRLAIAMLTVGLSPEESHGRTFAELRPDLPDRLHEETARLLVEPATDADLTLYLALIGMADPVAEGETERDRIRAEVLEEQRVEREKLAIARADVARLEQEERKRLAEEGEELRAAFAEEKARLEREFAAAQRLLAAERVEMQRIIAAERAELLKKRNALEQEVSARLAEIERAAAEDRANIEALREAIRKAGEIEMERKRAVALEELDDTEIRLDTGRFVTPQFMAPRIEPLPDIAFKRKDHLAKSEPIEEPTLPAEPWSVVQVVRKLRAPRRRPIPWSRWAVRGGIAAAILITAGVAVVMESRSPGFSDTRGASAPTPPSRDARRTAPPVATPVVTGATGETGETPTYSNESGIDATRPTADSAANPSAGSVASPMAGPVVGPTGTPLASPVVDSVAARARRDSVRRANAARLSAAAARRDSTAQRNATNPATRTLATPRDPQDLMDLSETLKGGDNSAGGAQQNQSPTPPR
jgi:hypothetical protein